MEVNRLFGAIDKNDVAQVRDLLESKKVRADCCKDDLSALQQAAFKGNVEICRLLLDHGADVNSTHHEQGYTALMFGALSGNADVCLLLLKTGANSRATNRIGRTAADLASFTGQYRCICVMRNFFPFSQLDRYIINRGSGSDARLSLEIATILYDLLLSVNVHPVHVVLFLHHHLELCKYHREVLYVTEELMDSMMKNSDCNEIFAFKLNIIFRTLEKTFKFLKQEGERNAQKMSDKEKLFTFAKKFLVVDTNGRHNHLNSFLVIAIQKFPFKQTMTFEQVMQELNSNDTEGDVPVLDVINQVVMGESMASKESFCVSCGQPESRLRCSLCKKDNYCSVECQKLHWFVHKRNCSKSSKSGVTANPTVSQQEAVKAVS